MYQHATGPARQLITLAEKAGAVLPKPVLAAYARISDGTLFGGNLAAATAEAVAAALAADRDPASDPAVQRLATLHYLNNSGVGHALTTLTARTFADTCAEHSDAIVQALRKPFDVAAKDLEQAVAVLGDRPLDKGEAGTILEAGGHAADAWGKAATATATIKAILGAWHAVLVDLTRQVQANPHHRALRLAAVPFDVYLERFGQEGSPQDAWDVARTGLPLHLPTAQEYRDRVQVLTDGHEQQRRETAATDRQKWAHDSQLAMR